MRRKIRVGIIFGGKSSEHEVSLLSAKNIYEGLDKEKYEPFLIGIDKNGVWHLRDPNEYLADAEDPKQVKLQGKKQGVAFLPEKNGQTMICFSDTVEKTSLDVVFPIVHGTNGEDGSLQGILKIAEIPFVGAGVLGSAIGMDKDVMKRLLRDAGIPIGKFKVVYDFEKTELSFQEITKELGLPLFIKPANNGSSIGISKVFTPEDFEKAIAIAFSYDRKILIEEFIKGREIECSVMGNEYPIVSLPGEVIPNGEFNAWDSKYIDNQCTFMIPALLEQEKISEVQKIALKTYQVLCCEGMARVDSFLTEDGRFLVNEINTLPGFTSLSVFPRLWNASGIGYSALLDKLIGYALERHQKASCLTTTAFSECVSLSLSN